LLLYRFRVGKSNRPGLRTWVAAVLVVCAVLDPSLLVKYGPYVAAALWLTGNPARFRIGWTVWLSALLLGWMWLSTRWAINPLAGQDVLVWVSLLVMFLVLQDLIRTRQQIRFLAWSYLIGLFIAVAVTLVTSWGGDSTDGRYTLGSLNANYLGYSLAAGFAVIALLSATKESTFTAKLWLVIIGAAIVVGIELTGTRGAELGLACLLVWLLMCKVAKKPPIRLLLLILTVAAVTISTGIIDQLLGSVDFGSRGDGTLSGRLGLWAAARDLWATSPWTGQGMWAMRASNPNGLDAHSLFLELGSALGIVGVVLFIALLWSILGRDTRHADPRLRPFLVGALLMASAPAYLSGAWEPTPVSWVLLAIFSGIGRGLVLHVSEPTHDHTGGWRGREHNIERRASDVRHVTRRG
jgi:O-antigen ligase